MTAGSIWVLHHCTAYCTTCNILVAEQHGPGDHTHVLNAARKHARATGHEVQVERGQHAHYRGWDGP